MQFTFHYAGKTCQLAYLDHSFQRKWNALNMTQGSKDWPQKYISNIYKNITCYFDTGSGSSK